jgi:hypothetical protein
LRGAAFRPEDSVPASRLAGDWIVHQAVRATAPTLPYNSFTEQFQEAAAIMVINRDFGTRIAAEIK